MMGKMRKPLYLASALVLAAGIGVGAAVYFNADEPSAALEDLYGSKLYVRDLRRFGGKAAVLFDELDRWFASLWEGKRLGLTIGVLSLLASGGLYFAGSRSKD